MLSFSMVPAGAEAKTEAQGTVHSGAGCALHGGPRPLISLWTWQVRAFESQRIAVRYLVVTNPYIMTNF